VIRPSGFRASGNPARKVWRLRNPVHWPRAVLRAARRLEGRRGLGCAAAAGRRAAVLAAVCRWTRRARRGGCFRND